MPKIYARAILPRKPFPPDRRKADRELIRAANEALAILVKYHFRITKGWESDVSFGGFKRIDLSKGIELFAYATGADKDIWKWLTEGTGKYGPKGKAYKIPKTGHARMTFRTGYQPKTTPQGGYKGPGTAEGPWVTKTQIEHPGIRPRPFPKHIARWAKPKLQKIFKNAMQRAKRALS